MPAKKITAAQVRQYLLELYEREGRRLSASDLDAISRTRDVLYDEEEREES